MSQCVNEGGAEVTKDERLDAGGGGERGGAVEGEAIRSMAWMAVGWVWVL